MNAKYELTDDFIIHEGTKLYRIRAIRNFSMIDEGVLGGYVESEDNLSHDGSCWVLPNAKVLGESKIMDGSLVISGVIKDSILHDSAVIDCDGATIKKSTIKGRTYLSHISNVVSSTISDSVLRYSSITDSTVERCFVEASVLEKCNMKNTYIRKSLLRDLTRDNSAFKSNREILE